MVKHEIYLKQTSKACLKNAPPLSFCTNNKQASNTGALALYEKLGFMRFEKLTRYYLNGGDAFRMRLVIDVEQMETEADILNS
jgi:hypothetical protein